MTGSAQVGENVKAEYMLVTPEIAKQWLGQHVNFRKLSKARVGLLADDIINGRWHINGESIKLTGEGILFDGQHRLAAVISAKRPIMSLVTWTDDTMGVDKGMGRTFGQLLGSKGYTKTAITQATTRVLYYLSKIGDVPFNMPLLTDDQLMEFFLTLDYPTLQTCMRWAHAASQHKLCPSTASYGAVMYVLVGIDVSKAETFQQGLQTGENLRADSPILLLRNRYQWMISTARRGGSRIPTRIIAALMIKAWNAFYDERPIKLLKFLDTEEFPIISGYATNGK